MRELPALLSCPLTRNQLDEMRHKVWSLLGGLPERCDLKVQRVDKVDLGDLMREELRYQVEPGEWVCGFVIRPKQVAEPLPAVVALHAHGAYWEAGKMEVVDLYPEGYNRAAYAGWGLELARRGYVVICQDQICFESRSWIHERGAELRGKDEQLEGFKRFAQGRCMMGKLAFDTSRAIDVLVGREDVDPHRIGVMGHSGGGIQSYNACMFDPRVMAAVMNCGLGAGASSIRDSRTSGATVPGMALLGDRAAAVAIMAPRAVLFVNGSEDWLFPTDGILNTYYRARKAYEALGIAERIDLTLFEGPHLFHDRIREHGFEWLDRWLKQMPIDPQEVWYRNERPDPTPIRTRKPDLVGLHGLCGSYSASRPDPQPTLRRRIKMSSDSLLEEVRIVVDETVHFDNKRPKLEPPNVASEYLANIRRQVDLPDFLDLWISHPPGTAPGTAPTRTALVLHRSVSPFEIGRDEIMGLAGDDRYAIAPALNRSGRRVATMDLLGHATRKNPLNQRRWKDQPQRSILFPSIRYIDAGTSLLERTIHEIHCVVAFLIGREDAVSNGIDLIGFGVGAFVGLMAALFEPSIRSVVAVGGVTTQAAAIEAELYDHFFLYQPGLIPAGDVDGALALLAPRRCRLICFEDDPEWPSRGARAVVKSMRDAYVRAGKENAFDVQWVAGEPAMDETRAAGIVDWLC